MKLKIIVSISIAAVNYVIALIYLFCASALSTDILGIAIIGVTTGALIWYWREEIRR